MDRADARRGGWLERHWLLLLFRGVAAIVFGIAAWLRPVVALAVLALLLGAYALVDGAIAVATAMRERRVHPFWWGQLVTGVLGVVVGGAAIASPFRAGVSLLIVIGLWAIASGLVEIVTALALRRSMRGEWRVLLSGIASVVLGLFFLARPDAAATTVHWMLSTYAIFAGAVLVALAFRTRSVGRRAAHP